MKTVADLRPVARRRNAASARGWKARFAGVFGKPEAPALLRKTRSDDTLRLCLIAKRHVLSPPMGGINCWSRLTARGLVERGHAVTVIGCSDDPKQPGYRLLAGEGYWSHAAGPSEDGAVPKANCLGVPPALARQSRRMLHEVERLMPERRFQLVGTPHPGEQAATALVASALLPNVLSLHTCRRVMHHVFPAQESAGSDVDMRAQRIALAERRALRRSTMILANSRAILRDISAAFDMDLSRRPQALVPHGLDDIPHPEGLLENRIAARKETGGPVRILFLGRLETRKGVTDMVPVLDRMMEDRSDVVVDLVGKAANESLVDLVRGLVARHPGRVTWHGYLPDAAVDGLMRRTDIFLAPSLYESFGLVFAEAKRYAIPSVACAAGGVPEVVRDGEDGILAPVGDRRALYDALLRLVDNAPLRNDMSRAARRNFENDFHYLLMTDRLVEVYRETIARWNRSRRSA